MADDKTDVDRQDPDRFRLNGDDVGGRARALGVKNQALQKGVDAAGDRAGEVRDFPASDFERRSQTNSGKRRLLRGSSRVTMDVVTPNLGAGLL
jgi:hypothetical protein